MKVLIISDLYPPNTRGGYEMRCKETVTAFQKQGVEVRVLTGRDPKKPPHNEQYVYSDLQLSPFYKKSKPKAEGYFRLQRRVKQIWWAVTCRRNYSRTKRVIQTFQPDLVFVWNMQFLDVAPILAAQDQGIPTAFSLGAYWLQNLKIEIELETNRYKRKYREFLLGIHHFSDLSIKNMITNSQALKTSYVMAGFPSENISVIPRGIDENLIKEHTRINTENHKIAMVGRICEDKGPDTAILALAYLRGQSVFNAATLDIIGTGDETYLQKLKALVNEHQLENKVQFLGWMEHRKVMDSYKKYSILLFPSRWDEPFGGTLLEAMANGLIVIATDKGGIPEIIQHRINGFLVPPDSPASMGKAILELSQNSELGKKIRTEAYKTIREKYTSENITNQLLNYLNNVLSESTKLREGPIL